ncbi:MAG: GAF domain-containing protein [Candidatus Marinimicrobia bacterium]|jgi:GAF domain-containing protein|nr:GAF domain-containing protein [Candidatus Neomarinimicrobiota bacterium]MBT3630109.1 GAF domain-containing protein [Candidatus Neomarinimicrobiota bacterium]MBT3826061.1 GAF domain-containing protein [Candidatus Neomarinimicrobiota bacterium]MBT4132095.1 GAF domain-containing protein [Candidatus Neomarinimicrobiota bacterium]MBT4296582.1 GAF domain-containing protein [Candidatus Neomarinimicrobiota bacterium]
MTTSLPHIKPFLNSIDSIINNLETRDEILQKISEYLSNNVDHYHWVGFYVVDDSGVNLILGPYVGAPTDHVKIGFGKGICGQVAVSEMSRIIQDVSLEDNYLSCSSNVQSEVVFPIMKAGKFVAELDIDSHAKSPFTDQDTELLEAICKKLAVLF